MYNIILASKSPRRQSLLAEMGYEFSVHTHDIVEDYPETLPKAQVPEYLSLKKANAFTEEELPKDYLIIASDTVVIVDDKILGKPRDYNDAKDMLRSLSGKTHQVVSGVTLRSANKIDTFSAVSNVTFAELSDEEIDFYLEKYKPFDKAGAYGVQEWIGFIGVKSLEGSFYNVMGLPTHLLYQHLKKF